MTPGDAGIGNSTNLQRVLSPEWYFDLARTRHRELFEGRRYVWEVLKELENYVRDNARREFRGQVSPGAWVVGDVFVGDGARIEPGAVVLGPAIIGEGCEIRSHAYIRPFVVVGEDSIVGHCCELKNCFIFPEAELPHFSYVGDSILGWHSHLGAGAMLSNVKLNGEPIHVHVGGQAIPTHLEKFGAILGDEVEVGCNTVLNPGTLVGPRTIILPGLSLRGFFGSDKFIKSNDPEGVVARRPKRTGAESPWQTPAPADILRLM
jgi:NDP-sugar pyrophosphorylase family protein